MIMHLGAQTGLKPMAHFIFNWMRILHLYDTKTKYSLYGMAIKRFCAWKNYIDRIQIEDYEHHVYKRSIILAPNFTTFQVC